MVFARVAFPSGCHKDLMPEAAPSHCRSKLAKAGLERGCVEAAGGGRHGRVSCEAVITWSSLSPPCLPWWYLKSNSISSNANRDDGQRKTPPPLFQIAAASTRSGWIGCCFPS